MGLCYDNPAGQSGACLEHWPNVPQVEHEVEVELVSDGDAQAVVVAARVVELLLRILGC
jgi:hypothetical protein